MRWIVATAGIVTMLALPGCGKTEPPDVRPAGQEKAAKTAALETASGVVQGNAPAEQLEIYLSGFHVMKNSPRHQMESHHFCRQVNQDLAQCALFDGNGAEANLVGIEYIISEKLFNTLPAKEKTFWHPHNYEILSGQLIAPGVPDAAELELMKGKMNSYGKTWHVWNTGIHGQVGTALPMGEPELAWSLNRDAEALPGLVEKRDRVQNLDTQATRKERADLIKLAHPQQGVDAMKEQFPDAGAYPAGVTPMPSR